MGNYSNDAASVRVDFFKESGKWYTTEAVKWKTYFAPMLVEDAFAEVLVDHLRDPETNEVRLLGMTAVCVEPYHENARPQMMTVERAVAVVDGTAPKYKPLRAP
jgi:hypothetical protein